MAWPKIVLEIRMCQVFLHLHLCLALHNTANQNAGKCCIFHGVPCNLLIMRPTYVAMIVLTSVFSRARYIRPVNVRCFVAIVRVYLEFFVFFVLRPWWMLQVFTPRMSLKQLCNALSWYIMEYLFQLSLVLVYTFAFRIGGKPRKYQGLVENFMTFMWKLCITSENMFSKLARI